MPTAYLYARLSDTESTQFCDKCQHSWKHWRGPVAVCPKCQTKRPVTSPDSIENQSDWMQQYCRARWSDAERPSLVLVKELGTAFKSFCKREESSKILSHLKEGDFLIACKLARGWRNTLDFLVTHDEVSKTGATLIVIHENIDMSTAMGKCIATVFAAFAEMERSLVSERQKASVAMRKAQGRSVGNPPYGKRIGICQTTGKKIIVDDEQELRMIKWIYVMRYKKRIPWNVMVAKAAELGFSARSGKMFSASHFRVLGRVGRVMNRAGVLDKIT